MSEVLRECVLLTQAQVKALPLRQGRQSLRSMRLYKAFPRERVGDMPKPSTGHRVQVLMVCAENVHRSFLPTDVYSLKTAPLQRLAKPTSLISCIP